MTTEIRPNVTGALLGLYAQTSLHPGAGTALGTVDLPVQRERHTHWPTIAGSALKGILRDACREQVKEQFPDDGPEVAEGPRRTRRDRANQEHADLVSAFGPATIDADKHAGALSVTDARVLAFPVRSLKGVFAWVSCAAVLDRFQRDLALVQHTPAWTVPAPVAANSVVLPPTCPCRVDETHIVLEECEFSQEDGDPTPIAAWIAAHLLPDTPAFAATLTRFEKQFLLLADDDFTHFVQHATEVSARIGLNYETKTVKPGALFYQEFLPPETLFYTVLLAHAARARYGGRTAAQALDFLGASLPGLLQIGGDETTGKGYCTARLWHT